MNSQTVIETLPFQGDFLTATEPVVLLDGPWRSGKTIALILDALAECERYPRNLLWFGRQEATKLRDSTIRDFHQLIPPTNRNWHEQRHDYTHHNGSVIMFRHMEDQTGLVNMDLGGAYIEQAEEILPEHADFLLGRLSRTSASRRMRLSCNPNGHDWLWQLFYPESPEHRPGYRLIRCPPANQNPHVPQDYVENLRASLSPEMFEQYVMGSRDVMLGYRFFSAEAMRFQTEQPTLSVGYFVDGFPKPEWREQAGGPIRLYERYDERDPYVIGADIATGEGSSWCAGVLLNCRMNRVAAIVDADLRPDELAIHCWMLSRVYGNAMVAPERNGIGFAMLTALHTLTANVYHDHDGKAGWINAAASRMELFALLQREIAHHNTELKDRELIEQAKAITMTKGKPKAERGFRDDLVIARGIAGMIRKLRLGSLSQTVASPQPSLAPRPELGSAYGFGRRLVVAGR